MTLQERQQLLQLVADTVAEYARKAQLTPSNGEVLLAGNHLTNAQNVVANRLGVTQIITGSAKTMSLDEFVAKVLHYNDLNGGSHASR